MFPRSIRAALVIATGSLLLTLSGCAGTTKTAQGPVFFPPPPNLPRIQFLKGISSSEDVEGKDSSFSIFAVGGLEQKQIRPILKPYGATIAGGKIYVADIAGQVVVIDLPHKSFQSLRGDNGIGKLKQPVKVVVDNFGYVYVADLGRKEVVVYDPQGEFVKTVGRDFDVSPSDVAVDDARIYLLDARKGIIRVVDRQTNSVVMDIGKSGDPESSLNLPMGMTIDSKGIIRVTNAGSGKVLSFDRDGHFLGAFGEMGDGFGQFSRPKGIAADANGYLYIVDSAFQNVQVFNEKGRIMMFFGGSEPPVGGMNLPAGIALTSENLSFFQGLADKNFALEQVVVVTNQFGDPKVSIYGFGKLRGIDYEKEYQRIRDEREKKFREEMEKRKQEEKEKKGEEGEKGDKKAL